MSAITSQVDRGVPEGQRYQFYDNVSDTGDFTLEFNFKSDLGKAAHSGYVKNNSAKIIHLYLNYEFDTYGSMQPVVVGGGDTFSFAPLEMGISSLQIKDLDLDDTLNVDVFVV